MYEDMEFKNDLIAKWLRVLMYVTIASLANSVITLLPFVPSSVTTWISRGIMVVMIVCMFQLAPVNARYKKAGIMRAVMLVCTLITAFLSASSILTLAASVLSIIAVYQEYSAYSELVADKDPKLSRQWHSLFNWSIAASLLIGFASMVTVVITAVLGMDAARVTSVVVGLLSVPQIVIDVVYLLYLKKMLGYFQEYSNNG